MRRRGGGGGKSDPRGGVPRQRLPDNFQALREWKSAVRAYSQEEPVLGGMDQASRSDPLADRLTVVVTFCNTLWPSAGLCSTK